MMAGGFSPASLSVLVVDVDSSCREDLQNILNKYYYQVKTSVSALEAAEMLQNERFDMVISDVNMTDMIDGFWFIRHVANKKIPIIMMSEDGETNKVMKGVQYGACEYLLKPIKPKDVQFIWQHVYRKRIYQIEGGGEDSHSTKIGTDGLIARNKRGGKSGGDSSNHVNIIKPKKPRLIWTKELNEEFEKAVEQCGTNKFGPKKILELMGDKSFTREQIASHLQKRRLNWTKNAEKEATANIHLQQQPPGQIQNQDFHTQNQVINSVNHYQGGQNSQIQNRDFQYQNQVASRINHYHGQIQNQDFQTQNQVINRINLFQAGQNFQFHNQDFQIQNQVASQINHYQGGQNFQNQVASPINHFQVGQNFQIQNQVASRTNHYQGEKNFQIQNQVASRINHYQGGQNFQIQIQDFQTQNQVINRINHYQGLNQCVQNLCESNDGYAFNRPFNSGNSQVQSESRVPQPADDYSVLLNEMFHGPPQTTGFPAVPEHIPHTTMELTDVVDPQNRFIGHPHSANIDDVPEPASFTSTLSNVDEQKVEHDFYPQNQISSSLPEAFDFGDPYINTGLFYPEDQINPLHGSDPNDGGNDPNNSNSHLS